MTTILYVHGTGVRSAGYQASLDHIRAGVAQVLPQVRVEPCPWGDVLGAGEPRPELRPAAGAADGIRWADAERAVWARLYDDPLYEIRLASLEARDTGATTSPQAARLLAARLSALTDDPGVEVVLPDPASAADLRSAAERLAADPEFDASLPWLAAERAHDLTARALVSSYISLREQDLGGEVIVAAAERDNLARAIMAALGGSALSVGSRARAVGWATAQRAAHPFLRRGRDALVDRAAPAAGDVLQYQARGGALRTFVAERVRELEGPVVLLGHSLGGIACFETLVGRTLPDVRLLVTVGSQIPYLYGLDALATLRFGTPLPERFPSRWLNIHDPVDLLSFPARPRFADGPTPGAGAAAATGAPGSAAATAGTAGTATAARTTEIRDVRVDTREPFPRAHSAYWTTPAVYEAVAAAVEDLGR